VQYESVPAAAVIEEMYKSAVCLTENISKDGAYRE